MQPPRRAAGRQRPTRVGLGLAAVLVLCGAADVVHAELDRLVAHIIPHSHCDPGRTARRHVAMSTPIARVCAGWLESFEGYYETQVGSILSSVTREVAASPRRRFVWSETSFFMRWFESSRANQRAFKQLVESGQVEFVGGGWVQNDEANPSYDAVLSQLSEGHEYLLTLFGRKPRIAWSIDPFGSSSATAAIAALAGYDALVINRVEHGVKDALKARAAMEFVWKPYATSRAVGAPVEEAGVESHVPSYTNVSIFTHVLHTHYSAPKTFDFESPEAVHVHAANVASRAADLASELRKRAQAYRTSHILVPWGDDFKFQDAGTQFRNMDQLIDYVAQHNKEEGAGPVFNFELRYSTLSDYFDAVWNEAYTGRVAEAITSDEAAAAARHDADGDGAVAGKIAFPVFTPMVRVDGGVDFFPYADNDASWWVGYYDSRPVLKQMIRRAFYSVRAADALLALARPWAGDWQALSRHVVAAASRAIAAAVAQNATADEVADVVAAQASALTIAPYATFSWTAAFQRIESARLDAALCLHHDAITGTSRAHVVDDYTQRMAAAVQDAAGTIADIASLLLGGLPKYLTQLAAGADDAAASSSVAFLGPAPLTHVPHVLPISTQLSWDDFVRRAGDSISSLKESAPAHPVVVYNPTGWRRRAVVSVMVDIGSCMSGSAGVPAAARHAWPIGLVVNDHRMPVASQWSAIIESARAGRSAFDAYVVGKASGPRPSGSLQHVSAWPAEPRSEATLSASAPDESLTTGTRYELAFEVDVPAYGLATYFVSAAWTITGVPDAIGDLAVVGAGVRVPASFASALAVAPPTLLVVPGLRSVVPPAGTAVPLPAANDRILVADTAEFVNRGTTGETSVVVIENMCLRVEVDAHTGLLRRIIHKLGGAQSVAIPVDQWFGIYSTSQSGAYIFRPVGAPARIDQTTRSADGSAPLDSVSVAVQSAWNSSQGTGVVHSIRVVGTRFSQTLRLFDTLSRADKPEVIEEACSDPLAPDSSLDIRPTVSARGNEELVMLLEAALDISGGMASDNTASPNVRDQTTDGSAYPSMADSRAGGDGIQDDRGRCAPSSVPHGWWTSDGLSLLRRRPAAATVADHDIQRYYYPLNTLTRVSGRVSDPGSGPASAWLSLYAAQPFGTSTRVVQRGAPQSNAVRMEVMLHRHLLQDDGRGLATGVNDGTVLTPRLALHVRAERHKPCPKEEAVPDTAAVEATGVDGVGTSHEDWLWTWATRAALHHQALVVLHADTVGAPAASTPSSEVKSAAVVPPVDASMFHGHERVVVAEAPAPMRDWMRRHATRFVPIQSDAWMLRSGAREDAYEKDLVAACRTGVRGLQQVCHHVAALNDEAAAGWTAGRASSNGLPPWLHVLTLQVRDAVTDDVVLRLQNFGGPSSVVDVEAVLGGSHAPSVTLRWADAARSTAMSLPVKAHYASATRVRHSHAPLHIVALRARSLTLNRHEGYASRLDGGARAGGHRHRLVYPSLLSDESVSAQTALGKFPLAAAPVMAIMRKSPQDVRHDITGFLTRSGAANVAARFQASSGMSIGELLGAGDKQNTEEQGVFLSDAALRKKKEDAAAAAAAAAAGGGGGRRLLAVPQREGAETADLDVDISPASIRSFVASVEANSIDPDDLVAALHQAAATDIRSKPRTTTKPRVPATPAAAAGQPVDKDREELIKKIEALVTDFSARDAMLSRVYAGQELSAEQQAYLRRREVKPARKHEQVEPSDLSDLVRKLTGADPAPGAHDDGKCPPNGPCPAPRRASSLADVPEDDPWDGEAETEQSLMRLLRVLQGQIHKVSTGWKAPAAVAAPENQEPRQPVDGTTDPAPAPDAESDAAPLLHADEQTLAAPAGQPGLAAAPVDDDTGEDFVVAVAGLVLLVGGVLLCGVCMPQRGGRGPLLPHTHTHAQGRGESLLDSVLSGVFSGRNALKRVVNAGKVQ